jgi:hypothetical protein
MLNGGTMTPELIACVEGCIASAEWMAKGEQVLKEFIRLRKEEPELFETLRRLIGMGAKLSDIRATEDLAERMGL